MSSRVIHSSVEGALDQASECFALFDANDRLVSFNDNYRNLVPVSVHSLLTVGTPLEKLVRESAVQGHYEIPDGDIETFISDRMEEHRNLPYARETRFSNGRWLRRTEHHTQDGGSILMLIDVTDRVTAELKAAEAQATLHDAVESLSDGFVLFDADDRLVRYNTAYENMVNAVAPGSLVIGATFEELLQVWIDVGAYDLTDTERDTFIKNRLATHRNTPSQHQHQHANARWMLVAEYPTNGGGTVLIQHDVSQIKEAELRAVSLQNQVLEVLESLSEAFALFDADDRLVLFNEAFLRLNSPITDVIVPGVSFEEIIRTQIKRGLHPSAKGRVDDFVSERLAIHRNPPPSLEQELKDGLWLKITEFRTPSGAIAGLRSDITEQKRAEREVVEAKELAESANRAKSEFLGNMSHELRTPLNAVNGFAQMLMNQTFGKLGDARYLDYAGHIHESGEHLLDVINDILDLSRIEAGKISLQDEIFKIDDVLASCIIFLESRISDKQLRMTRPPDQAWPELRADKRVVRQMLLNLLSNAVKFSYPGSRIDVAGQIEDDGGLTIIITDTGIGLTDEEIVIAMEPFGQVKNSLSEVNEGTGLGLPLVKSMIELHGGAFEIRSEKDVGTQVSLAIPTERVMKPD
ncbi:MAG: PAS domain-containing protein [Alphaproteobacteria bacterium]|nr:PAS domain-containing protein [Alphaproteobacteria bacterium]MBT4965047.1 PAS domain-containing protein [Alphaproteobacteria bacterium]